MHAASCRGLMIAVLAAASPAAAEPLQPGLYEIAVRLVMPNLGDAIQPATLRRCLPPAAIADGSAFAVLSSNNPLAACPRLDWKFKDGFTAFRIACEGPNMAKADASFEAAGDRFQGRFVMNMGGKNMTMTEYQLGRRIGNCP
jgi:Protein of unknown function (DUF3617)